MRASRPVLSVRAWLPELEPGSHAVGYRQQWFEDPTRTLQDPRTGVKTKRPILLSVWYPSEVGHPPGGDAMAVDDYLRVEAPGAGPWRDRLEHHVRKVRDQEVFGGEPKSEIAELSTMARRDAGWAEGRFPLVLAHPGLGASFSDNFVLWEYLASHGFVVVSGAFLDASGLSSAIEWDPATSIADLDRIFEVAARWPGVDGSRVVVVGHSYGAQAAFAYALAGRDLLAVVSLDSTLEYADEDEPWFDRPEPARYLGQRSALRIPVLVLHAGGRTHYVEGLTHAERTIVSLPVLRHNDFITHGGVLRAAHSDPGDPEVRAGFARAADIVRRFLSRVTALDVRERATWQASSGPVPADWIILSAEAPAPDLSWVLELIRELGPADAYDRCVAQSNLAESLFNEAGYVFMRAGALTRADEVLAVVVDRVPESWNAWDSWAEVAAEQGMVTNALERYRKALDLVLGVERPASGGVDHRNRIEARISELEGAR